MTIPVPVLLAGFIGGFLSVFELFFAKRKKPSWRASGFVITLFGFDGASSMLVYPVLTEALKGLTWFVGAWPVILAGLCGPALLRSQLSLLGSGQEEGFYGPAARYRRFQRRLEECIDEEGAAAQGDWVANTALPMIEHLAIAELRAQIENFIKALDHIEDAKRDAMLVYVSDTLADQGVSESDQRHAVVQYLIDNGYRRFVRSLVRRGRKVRRAQEGRRRRQR